MLADALIAGGERDATVRALRRAARDSPDKPWVLQQAGEQLTAIGLAEEGRRWIAESEERSERPASGGRTGVGPSREAREFWRRYRDALSSEAAIDGAGSTVGMSSRSQF